MYEEIIADPPECPSCGKKCRLSKSGKTWRCCGWKMDLMPIEPCYVDITSMHGAKLNVRRCRCGSANIKCGGEAALGAIWCEDCGASVMRIGGESIVKLWNEEADLEELRAAAQEIIDVDNDSREEYLATKRISTETNLRKEDADFNFCRPPMAKIVLSLLKHYDNNKKSSTV